MFTVEQEGEEFLRRSGALSEEGGDEISIGKDDEDDDDTRAQDEENNDECIPSLVRDTTMKETAKVRNIAKQSIDFHK